MEIKEKDIVLKKSQYHPFHIVDPSPWPAVVSLGAFLTTSGFVCWMHGILPTFACLLGPLVVLSYGIIMWFKDIVKEAKDEGHHTTAVQTGIRYGMVLFILSETMLFFAFFWAFFHSSLSPAPEIGGVWPPKGIEVMNPWGIPLLNTGLLLASGASLTWSHSGLLGGSKQAAYNGIKATIILALIFTALQGFEYVHAPFDISDGIYGSTFYMLTGLHGVHVILGTSMLFVALHRIHFNHFTTENHLGFETAAWYWHFVDVVWIFLYISVYIWGSGYNY